MPIMNDIISISVDLWTITVTVLAYPLEISEFEEYLQYMTYDPYETLIIVLVLQMIKAYAILLFIAVGKFLDLELERLAEIEFQLAVRRHYLDLRRLG